MKVAQCYHFRIRDTNEYGMDVERFIKSIEKEYKIDFRSIGQWKQLVEQLHAATTDYNRKLQKSKWRKSLIIDKIYTQNTRASPFELTEDLVRTAGIWKAMALKCKNVSKSSRKSAIEDYEDKPYDDIGYSEIPGENTVAHPNTEIAASPEQVEDIETDTVTAVASHLPTNICINQHQILSPLYSNESSLSYRSIIGAVGTKPDEPKEYLILEQTSAIRSMPKEITITKPTLKEQCLKFSLLNCTSDYMHVRFKTVTERAPFKSIKILPVLPTKLYPGISVTYKLIFKLSQTEEFSPSGLYFRVGRNEEPTEALLIPIVSSYTKSRKIFVTKTVSMAPVYPWHINKHTSGFPTELVKISNGDDCNYHLHIIKRFRDFTEESTSIASVNAISLNTSSILQRADDENVGSHNDIFSNSKDDNLAVTDDESLKTIDFITLVVHETVESALEAFVFEHTYLNLHPYTTRYIPVYLTKAEHTGFHQCYYDFEIWDFESDQYILTKTIQVFAEVLPHPVQIEPEILDMSNSPITHGYCEDGFIVNNTHKLFNVKAYIKLTTKMKKLFHVSPTEASVPAQSSVKFTVRLCTKNVSTANIDELAHFTFKIIFSGLESVYKNVPPYFYEIIVPCAPEFKKIYNEKFFAEVPETSEQELTSSKILVRTTL